jgi:hypothetical protein
LPGRTAREAVDNYVKPIQQSLSCVTQAVLRPSGYGDTRDSILTFPGGAVPLGSKGLRFNFVQRFRTIPLNEDPATIKVQTTYYTYAIEAENGEEVIGYHWHPHSVSRIEFPHLHLGNGARVGREELEGAKAHLPTGRVGVEEVIDLLIETFDVETRRKDWKSVLRNNFAKFIQHATWGKRSP